MAIATDQLAIAMGFSLLLIAIIIALANLIHWLGRERAIRRAASHPPSLEDVIVPPKHFILLRVLLDKNEHASLSAFQFLMWTLIIAFLYITLWFLQLLSGSPQAPPAIPPGLMALMGISLAVPIAGKAIADFKKFRPRTEGETYAEPRYASMLEEEGRPSLLRLQMFLWTIAALVIYIWQFVAAASAADITVGALGLQDIDPTLLFLMGLSQTGYLGSKAYSGTVKKTETEEKKTVPPPVTMVSGAGRQPCAIREIIPRALRPAELVIMLGSGFGVQRDTIMIGEERVPAEKIRRWDDTRIEFALPEKVAAGKHAVRVITAGSTAELPVTVSELPWVHRGLDEVDADIISEIWIDDPTQKGYRVPQIGYFIPDKRYYFFFEFAVPPGTPSWGRTQFRARFSVDNRQVGDAKSFMPGSMNGRNYGVFDYKFDKEGTFPVEIRGENIKKMDVTVKKPPGA